SLTGQRLAQGAAAVSRTTVDPGRSRSSHRMEILVLQVAEGHMILPQHAPSLPLLRRLLFTWGPMAATSSSRHVSSATPVVDAFPVGGIS
ncbi:hypothetical protein Tco_0130610, partial [Tanacetum coccineum]